MLELLLVTGTESVRLLSAPFTEGGLLMKGTILLLATVAPALLLVGGVATSKQRQESISSQSPTSDKSGGDVSIQSTTLKAEPNVVSF